MDDGPGVSQSEGGGIRARLFDADHPDQRLDRERLFEHRPTERQLLWIDVTGQASAEDARRLADLLGLRQSTRGALERRQPQPYVSLHRDYLHVRVAADPNDRNPADTAWLDVIAGPNVVVTEHERDVPFLADLDARIQRDAAAGILSSTAFFTAIIDGAITTYHAAVDAIEDDVDRLDADSLRGVSDPDALLADLVRSRRRIARLRRVLADHRGVFTGLASPEVGRLLEDDDAATMLQGLSSRFDGAIGAVEDARDALLGSFDVFMSRTAQRTNEVMKVLTLVTVLLLPGSMIAGLLGMNVIVPLDKDDPMSFWFVIAAIVVLAVAIIVGARRRRWL